MYINEGLELFALLAMLYGAWMLLLQVAPILPKFH